MRQGSVSEFAQEIVTPLGSEKQGEKSLKSLVEQSEEEETETWDVKHLPLSIRFPWLTSAVVRGVSALVTGVLLAQLFQLICSRIAHVYCGGLSCRSCGSCSLDSIGFCACHCMRGICSGKY